MKTIIILLAAAAWAVTGCSGGNASEESASRAPDARTAAGEPAADDHAGHDHAADQAASGEAVEQADRVDKDMALAEARRQSQERPNPAVETSELSAAPPWALRDLEGNTVKSTDFSGKVVLLNFWATWCGPCKMEIPDFIRLTETYGNDLAIVGVAMDREGVAKVAPFVEQAKINYPIVIGNQRIATDFGPISAIPVTYVLTRDGKIYKRYIGARPGAIFEADIKALL